jgi:hypothetical protein
MDNLDNIKKQNHFSVPKDYFEYLPAEITERIQKEPKQKILFIFKPAFAFSSLAVIIAGVVLFLFLHKTDSDQQDLVLSENDVQHIIDNPDLYNIDEEDVTDAIVSSNIPADSLNTDAFATDDEIKNFLEENSNTNNIINNL